MPNDLPDDRAVLDAYLAGERDSLERWLEQRRSALKPLPGQQAQAGSPQAQQQAQQARPSEPKPFEGGVAGTLGRAWGAVGRRFGEGVQALRTATRGESEPALGSKALGTARDLAFGALSAAFPFSAAGGRIAREGVTALVESSGEMQDEALLARLEHARQHAPNEVPLYEQLLALPYEERIRRVAEGAEMAGEFAVSFVPGYTLAVRGLRALLGIGTGTAGAAGAAASAGQAARKALPPAPERPPRPYEPDFEIVPPTAQTRRMLPEGAEPEALPPASTIELPPGREPAALPPGPETPAQPALPTREPAALPPGGGFEVVPPAAQTRRMLTAGAEPGPGDLPPAAAGAPGPHPMPPSSLDVPEEVAAKMITEAGAEFRGVTEDITTGGRLYWVHDPVTGSTGLVTAENLTPEHLAKSLAESRAKFRAAEQAKQVKAASDQEAFAKLAAYEEATANPETFQRYIQKGDWVILSAERPERTGFENAQATADLLAELLRRKYRPIPAKGRWTDPTTGVASSESSFLVPAMSEAEGLELGSRFSQNSILTPRGEVDIAGRVYRPADLSGLRLLDDAGKAAEAGYTEIKIGDQDIAFTIPINRDVTLPLDAPSTVRLEHYTPRGDLEKIDPEFFGTGQAGRERARAQDPGFLPRSYYYVSGSQPEARFKGQPYTYSVEVPAARIYNLDTDPAGLAKTIPDPTELEKAIREAGYVGYQRGNVVALFEPQIPRDVRLNGSAVESLSTEFEAAKRRLIARWAEMRSAPWLPRGDRGAVEAIDIGEAMKKNAQLFRDLRTVGAVLLWSGARSFKAWSAEMVARYGEEIRPILKGLFEESGKHLDRLLAMHPGLATFKQIEKLMREGQYAAHWYDDALPTARRALGQNAELYIDVYAALSPRTQAETGNFTLANKAFKMIVTGQRNADRLFTPEDGFIDAHLQNLNRILRGEPLSGPKVGEFSPALRGDRNAVTVDSWMSRAFGMSRKDRFGKWHDPDLTGAGRLEFIQEATRAVARQLGLDPRGGQAAIWAAFRTIEEELDPGTIKTWSEVFEARVKELGLESLGISPETRAALEKLPAWSSDAGRARLTLLVTLSRAAAGGFIGSLTGDDPETAARNALIGAGLGTILSARLARAVARTIRDPEVRTALADGMRSQEGALREPRPRPTAANRPPSPNVERMDVSGEAKSLVRDINDKLEKARKLSRAYVVTHDETIAAALTSRFRNLEDVLNLDTTKLSLEELPAARTAARGVRDFVIEDYLETAAKAKATGDPALAAEARKKFLIAGAVSRQVADFETWVARAQEAGRIVSHPERPAKYDYDRLARDLADLSDELGRTVTDEQLLNMTLEQADRARVSALASTAGKYPRALWDIYYGLNLLSSPVTHAKNILGDMTGLGIAVVDRAVAEGLEVLMYPFTAAGLRKQQVAFGEAYDLVRSIWETAGDALRAGKQTALTGESGLGGVLKSTEATREGAVRASLRPGSEEASGLGKLVDVMATAARANLRFMDGTDEFFKVLSFAGELRALARRKAMSEGLAGDAFRARVRELIDNPTPDMLREAHQFAHENTFTKAFEDGRGWRNLWGFGGAAERFAKTPLMRLLVVPFYRTPTRLLEFSTTHTPLLNALAVQTWSDLAAGGAKAELAMAKMVTGSMVVGLAAWYAAHGLLTGDWPKDPAYREALRRAGWAPYSFYVPPHGRYYSYAGLEPLSTIVGTVANMVQLFPHLPDHQVQTLATAAAIAAAKSAVNNPYAQGVSDLADVIEGASEHDNINAALKFIARRAAALTPGAALGRAIARATDTAVRETRTVPEAPPEWREVQVLINEFRKAVPGWSQTRPALRNLITGEPIPMETGWLGLVSPFQITTNRNDPVLNEIAALEGASLPREIPRVIGGRRPSDGVTVHEADPREGVLLTDSERAELAVLLTSKVKDYQGRTLYQALRDMIVGPGIEHELYADASDGKDGGKAAMIRATFRGFLEEAEQRLLARHPDLASVVQRRQFERAIGRLPRSAEGLIDPLRQMERELQTLPNPLREMEEQAR